MLMIYWFCFAIGGVFVFLAMLGGWDHGVLADPNWDSDLANHGLDSDLDDVGLDGDLEFVDPQPRNAKTDFDRYYYHRVRFFLFRMFTSLKFWTFGGCFFGLTGLVLSNLAIALHPMTIAIAAVAMGLVCGSFVSGILQALRYRRVDSLVRTQDLVGLIGTVEIPLKAGERGKVRLQVKGNLVDMIAYTDAPQELQQGQPVLVVSMDDNRLWVVATREEGEWGVGFRRERVR